MRNKIVVEQLPNIINTMEYHFGIDRMIPGTTRDQDNYLIFCTSQKDTQLNCKKLVEMKNNLSHRL